MTGPERTNATSNRRKVPLRGDHTPRPPNAWILYRSDKLKELAHLRIPQADVSKVLSENWKNETADIKAHYERQSEILKAEHKVKYPDYRFQPMKKEEKDRIRAEKQEERKKERLARKAKGRSRVVSRGAQQPLFTTEARLPIGADASGALVVHEVGSTSQTQPSLDPGSSSRSSSESSTQATPAVPTPLDQVSIFTLDQSTSSDPTANHSITESSSLLDGLSYDGGLLQTGDETSIDFSQFLSQPSDLQDYLNVPLPDNILPPLPDGAVPPPQPQNWNLDDPATFAELAEFLSNASRTEAGLQYTNDPNLFHLSVSNPSELANNRAQAVEIFMGTPAPALPDPNQLSNLQMFLDGSIDIDLDSSLFQNGTNDNMGESHLDPYGALSLPQSSNNTDLNVTGVGTSYDTRTLSQSSNSTDLDGFSFSDFVQGDVTQTTPLPIEADGPRDGPVTPISNGPFQVMSLQTYAPPTGAANTSIRRVAADWRHVRAFSPEPQTLQAPVSSEPVWR